MFNKLSQRFQYDKLFKENYFSLAMYKLKLY